MSDETPPFEIRDPMIGFAFPVIIVLLLLAFFVSATKPRPADAEPSSQPNQVVGKEKGR
jgi:hypothetical protein